MAQPLFESVIAETDSSFRCVHLQCSDFVDDHAWHLHPEYELLWVVRSHGTRFVGDSIERYQPGDLVLNGPNLPHCYRNEPIEGGQDAPEWIVVQFGPELLNSDFLTLPECRPIQRLLAEARCGLSFSAEVAEAVGPQLRALAAQQGMGRLLRLMEILDRLANDQGRTRLAATDYHLVNQVDRVHIQRVEAVQNYIRSNLGGVISQAEIAEQLGMKAPAFSKFFRAATGQTFMGLVKILRINEACRLLADTQKRITDIAFECGYQHTSHFDLQFFELKAMSPSEYRRLTRMRIESAEPRGGLTVA